MPQSAANECLFSILICTYNRADLLREALHTVLEQRSEGLFDYEVIVVDNNSTDSTRSVVESYQPGAALRLRYLFEQRQGKSYALNDGLEAASGSYFVIVDDDMLLPSNWLIELFDGVRRYPDAAFLGGKVLPLWSSPAPPWLTSKHWSAIAVADYGDDEMRTDAAHQICLLAAAHQAAAVRSVGGYAPKLGVSATRIGSVEDVELLIRLWGAGRYGMYLPTVIAHHRVEPHRLSKSYHRKWHRDHGRFFACMREASTEGVGRRLFGVPAYMFREIANSAGVWLYRSIVRRPDEAFEAETRFWFLAGFSSQRLGDVLHERFGTSRTSTN